jgi:hypothetical protein
MVSTCCPNDQSQSTFTPIVYNVQKTYTDGQDRFTDWLFDKDFTGLAFTYNQTIGIIGFKSNGNNLSEYEPRVVSTKENSVIEKIDARIFNRLTFPKYWEEENILQPNMLSKVKAFEICRHLFKEYNLIPDRIASTREEGIFLAFETDGGERTLILEIYNDLDASMLINDNINKKILYTEDVLNLDFAKAIEILND